MKTYMKVCLILSLILVVIGGLLCFVALYRVSFDWNKLTFNVENETYDYIVVGTVRNVQINTKQADVRVARSANSSCTVRAKIPSRDGCTAVTRDGLLTVTCTDDPSVPWYKKIWSLDDMTVTVFLPEDSYESLRITTDSGDVSVSDALSFSSARTKTDSGDQEICSPVSDDLSATSSSGDIAVKRMGCKTVSVTAESGEVFLDSCRSDSVTASTSSGSVSLAKCTVKNVKTNSASGDQVFSQVVVSEKLVAVSSSGYILLLASSAGEIQITAKSGDVTGRLTEPMLFDVRSDSGVVDLPPSDGTGRCTVRTGSGDVTFTMWDSNEG